MPLKRARTLLATLIITLAAALAVPAPALASRLPTDVVYGKAESARTDLADADKPDITARAAIAVGKDGTVYFERDADAEVKIASVTKVMTAILALEKAKLTDTVTVDHAAATVGGSSAELKEGDTLSMDVALKGLMIPSGNDAAMAIAVTVGKQLDSSSTDPLKTFVDAMNAKAKELGMKHTLFTNPSGLDFDEWESDQHSTARDVATMFAHAMKNEEFRKILADTDHRITVTSADGTKRDIDLDWHNKLLGTHGNIGGKTGTTDAAGYCFAAAYRDDVDGEAYVVNLGSESDAKRFDDNAALADWLFGHMIAYPLVTSDKTSAEGTALVARVSHADWSDRTVDVVAAEPDKKVGVFSLAGGVEEKTDLPASVSGDVKAGQKLGTLTLTQDGHEVGSVELVSAENEPAPSPLQWLLVQGDRVIRLVTGKPVTASSEQLFKTPEPSEIASQGQASA